MATIFPKMVVIDDKPGSNKYLLLPGFKPFLSIGGAKIQLLVEHLADIACITGQYDQRMITVIQATNRPDSNTEFVSRHIVQLLSNHYEGPIGYISMVDVPPDLLSTSAYSKDVLPEKIALMQDDWMVPAEKFIWILPEYNGSFPGVLKLFIDAISVRKYNETFKLKKSMLIGIATGRSGNIRGMDHLAGILIHMKSIVYPRLLPVSQVNELMDERGLINHTPTLKTLDDHLKGFVEF